MLPTAFPTIVPSGEFMFSAVASKRFSEFAGINYRNCCKREIVKVWINKRMLTSFIALGMRSEGNVPKNVEPAAGFSFTTMLQHTRRFWWSVFLAKNKVAICYLPRLKSASKGRLFCDATDIIKNATGELNRVSQNGFQKCFQHF